MNPADKQKFGKTGLEVTAFSYGTVPIGNIFEFVEEETSDAMIQHCWDSGIRFYDTAPMYGHGLSEHRLGHSLRWKNRDDYILGSKVGRVLTAERRSNIDFERWAGGAANVARYDYSYDGTMRSFEDSLQRMALERMDICFIHDCDFMTHGDQYPEMFKQAMDGCWKALERLRDEGVIKAIGLGVNEASVCHEALLRHDFDCFLLAGRYTLLEQEPLDAFLPLCAERDVAVVIGGGFNSGILAAGAVEGARYNYAPAPPEIMDKVRKIETICNAHNVPLAAAAMQFPLAHPAVPTFCAGTRNMKQLENNLAWFSHPIPVDFWAELKHEGLLRKDAPTPS